MKDEQILYWSKRSDGLTSDKVDIFLSEKYQRQKCHIIDPFADDIWKKETAQNTVLYDASKFRLHSVELLENGRLAIHLGLTSYKDFVVTNLALSFGQLKSRASETFAYGLSHFNDSQACLSDAVGVNAIVTTKDEHVLLIHRSQHVQEFKNMMDIPGGHPEPKEVPGLELESMPLASYSSDNLLTLQSKVLHELFYSAVKEVRDEVNIPEAHISFPSLLGILRCNMNSNKPVLTFLARCSLDCKDIIDLYSKGCVEEFETTGISFVKIKDLQSTFGNEESSNFDAQNLTPYAQTALHMFATISE